MNFVCFRRKWNRSKALERGKAQFPDASKLRVTELNSLVRVPLLINLVL